MENKDVMAGRPVQWEGQREGGSTLDQIKTTVADKLRSASRTLEERTGGAPGRETAVSGYGRQAAHWLDRSADYVNDFDPQRVKADIENQVRRNPGRTLMIAAAAGLALGVLLRRR